MTHTPDTITYSSTATRETLCIALTMAALRNLEVKAGDIFNPHVMAPNREKILTVLEPDFWDDAGKFATIVRELYGLKNAGASFWAHLAKCMQELGYHPCDADPDL